MLVKDDPLWQELVGELKSTDHGKPFHEFLVSWCDRAEQIMEQDGTDPADALRLTLASTEENSERKNVWILGQALVVICMHWKHGEEAANRFTELELRLIEDIAAAKIAQLQAMAEDNTESE